MNEKEENIIVLFFSLLTLAWVIVSAICIALSDDKINNLEKQVIHLEQFIDHLDRHQIEIEPYVQEFEERISELESKETVKEHYKITKGTIVALGIGDDNEKIAILEIDETHRVLLEYTNEDLQIKDEVYLVWFDDGDYLIIEVVK